MQVGSVVAVSRDHLHRFSKRPEAEVRLIAGIGVDGDAHHGTTVQHRSRVAVDPSQPNLRQVHLIQAELFDELRSNSFEIESGDLGENITTLGINLLALPRSSLLRIGLEVVLEVTGLRNPCSQIEQFRPGLLAAVLYQGAEGEIIRKAGIMAIVRDGGLVRSGDVIKVELPALPHTPLDRV